MNARWLASTTLAGLVTLGLVTVGLVSPGLAPNAHALDFTGGGGKIGYMAAEGDNDGLALGAHVELESAGSNFHLRPNVLYWDGDDANGFTAALDGLYHFGSQSETVPYLGAGAGFTILDPSSGAESQTDPAINMFGGVQFPAGQNLMFMEGRYTVSDVSQASLGFGVTFR
ncbi:MAG: hypothetical protein ACREOU_08300 [Candidatus Eiseniibacteriota bacterium]